MATPKDPNLTFLNWTSQRGEETDDVLHDVKIERWKQDVKWGIQEHTPNEWLSILAEELGEYAQEINRMTWGGKGDEDYEFELIQVAAVAVAALENLARQRRRAQ